jgi:DNA-binding NtrC family response regulator
MSKILLVDDEPRVLRSLTAALELDHDIFTSESGSDAKDVIEAGAEFDAIISDQIMPEMKGHELLNWCRVKSPKSKRIMLTGVPITSELKQELDDLESVRIFRKPWNIEEINELLKSVESKPVSKPENNHTDIAIAGHKVLVFEPSERYLAMCLDLAPRYFNRVIHCNTREELTQNMIDHDDAKYMIFSLRDGSKEELDFLRHAHECSPDVRILVTAEPRSIRMLNYRELKVAGFEALIKPFSFKRLANIVVGAN